ncbi:DUF4123 domain-containing protein [Variovorax dokdonensis]|uniref:DUF4123 domain-containing protein n=1 Tax=Variovorax dokdonensis TaxID=344883 RepID=A0ABT7NAE4_9BURK|nr:DUF4123 domain-containing protein [Variovorax dokdonensis]MDM0044899.1 DUF4123 domain-containing protein [Variovorax dokdonensis]
MNVYCLLDGAMAAGVLGDSKIFNDPDISWLTPIYPRDKLRLVGPFLVESRALPRESPERKELDRVLEAFPHRLHAALISTTLTGKALAQHLLGFCLFRDRHGDTYGVRIADARVMSYLPRILTERQWRAMSAPIARWQINDRRGNTLTIHESDSKGQPLEGEPEIFRLSEEQIEQLIEASEPDSLLSAINKHPTLQQERLTQLHYDAARACFDYWKSTGNPSRGPLLQFASLVFEREPGRFKDREWLKEKYQQALRTTA